MSLFKVSGSINKESEIMQYEPDFEIGENFARTRMADDACIFKISTPLITEAGEVIGTVLFEKSDHSEITLNWYFTSL